MDFSASSASDTQSTDRQAAGLPRAGDGVGNALRQIFDSAPALPSDLAALLDRLNDD